LLKALFKAPSKSYAHTFQIVSKWALQKVKKEVAEGFYSQSASPRLHFLENNNNKNQFNQRSRTNNEEGMQTIFMVRNV
jgi:hypothetical protein